jgi:hypothetical protein
MRERKKRIKTILILMLIISIIGFLIFIGNKNFYSKISALIKENSIMQNTKSKDDEAPIITDDKITEEQINDEQIQIEEDNSINDKQNTEQQIDTIEFSLPSGDKVTATVDTNNGIRSFNSIDIDNIYYSINQTKDKAVILDVATQSLLLVQTDGIMNDITDESYRSSGGKVYTKEAILQSNPGYIWVTLPKFINDDRLAYVTQLPWFKAEGDLYLWEYSISNKTYINKNYKGKEIQFGNNTEGGLEIYIDGNRRIIN